MNPHAFDAITRQSADSVSRRRSVLALGGAALAASLALPQAATAKQNRKGKGKNNNGKDRCKAQVGKCQDGIASLCLAIFAEDSAECTELFAPCCGFLQNCETAQAFACAVDAFESVAA